MLPLKKLNTLPQNIDEEKSDLIKLGRFPSWLHRKMPRGIQIIETSEVLSNQRLPTVCEEARCPNLQECWSKNTATFLLMGKECTRNCGFCSIDFSKTPKPLEENEGERVAASVKGLRLKHVVLTMVARDDLPDGGASHFKKIIETIREENPDVTIETLSSDFNGNKEALKILLSVNPEVFNYNIETVRSLTPRVRHKATYERTLEILSFVKTNKENASTLIKSGLMVGLGETKEEVFETLNDLKQAGCDIVTIGQYLQSDPKKLLVKSFIHPDVFKEYELFGTKIGIPHVYSAPFVRSSYNADLVFEKTSKKKLLSEF